MSQPRVYLSRRNLLTLLAKLDRVSSCGSSHCIITKRDNKHERYPQTMASLEVVAVEDEDYYVTRNPGMVHPDDRQDDRPEDWPDIFKELVIK